MTNLDIIRKVAAECGLPAKTCRSIVDLFWTAVAEDLGSKSGRSQIHGFGTFHRKLRKARVSKPPRGGETFVPSHYTVTFKPMARKKAARAKKA